MANKMQFYAQMAEDAARQITGSREQWTAFLRTAARLYKYPYHEQLMIFAQRPDATACAEYDLWNDTMRRYVRRGSKGIALIDTRGDRPRLRYVFDVSDTGERKNSRSVQLWEMKEEYREPIMQALEQAFEVSREGQSLESMIYAAAERLAADYWDNYSWQILDIVEDSYLAGYDGFETGVAFRRAAATSIAYCLYSRCTDDPDSYFEHEDFLDIFDFNTRQAANTLGTAVSSLSAQIFREIEVTTRNYERTKAAQQALEEEYKREPETVQAVSGTITEGSESHDEGSNVHAEGGLSDPGHSDGDDRGKYGRMRRAFLEENNPMLLNDLILSERLFPHLWEIQRTATARIDQLMIQLLQKDPAPDKKTDPMAWTQHMNSLKAQAEEIVTAELITS